MASFDPKSVFDDDHYGECDAVVIFDHLMNEMYRASDEVEEVIAKAHLYPVEEAASILLPQSMQLIAAMRHSIAGSYLYGAAVLLRPIVERIALLSYLHKNPSRVQDWWQSWPQRSEPSFGDMVRCMETGLSALGCPSHRQMLNSLVHGNADSIFAVINSKKSNIVNISPHQMRSRPDLASVFAFAGSVCVMAVVDLLDKTYSSRIGSETIERRVIHCLELLKPMLDRDLWQEAHKTS